MKTTMKNMTTIKFTLLAIFAGLFLTASTAAQEFTLTEQPFSILAPQAGDFTNFQAASNVLGQATFTTSSTGTNAAKFNLPDQAIVDPVSGKIFVSDETNNRVLRFASTAAVTNGASAEAVLGQPDFTTITSGAGANKMFKPTGISLDVAGRLWVAEFSNNRILRFDNAATKATGANADAVLGQPDFVTITSGAGANKVFAPIGVFADSSGRLWVAERGNHRVLRFDNAAAKANGGNADGVLGQPDFATVSLGTTASKMRSPHGLTLDTDGRLYVADRDNNRVLRFDAAATKANGAAADVVFGQPDFATVSPGTTAAKMEFVLGVATDADNRLYVADAGNNRVLVINNAGTAASGAAAARVLGQPNFTSGAANSGGISAATLNTPYMLFFDELSSSLFVGDYGNQRVLRFTPLPATAASVSIGGRVSVGKGLGLTNALVYLTDSYGNTKTTRTSTFGYFRFDSIAAGQTVIVTVMSKRFTFTPQVVGLTDNLDDLNFVAESSN